MKRIFSAVFIVAVAAASLALFPASGRPVLAARKPATCSNATLTGSYGFSFNGFDRASSNSMTYVPFAGAGVATFDGVGSVTAEFSVSTNGSIGSDPDYTGTYTVNANCSGEIIATPGTGGDSISVAVVSSGAEILGSSISPGNTWAFDAKKQ
jgi:hypothetical protein